MGNLNFDANLIENTGFYSYSGGNDYPTVNLPAGYCMLFHFRTNGYYGYLQLCFDYNCSRAWARSKEPGATGVWFPWKVIYDATV